MELRGKEDLPRSPYVAYLGESKKPIVSLLFILPILIIYHTGVYLLPDIKDRGIQNGADYLLAGALNYLGVGGPLISAALVVVVLLFLQQYKNLSWTVRPWVLLLMVLESLIFALPPFFLAFLAQSVAMRIDWGLVQQWGTKIVLSMGAGVYEEFLFRLLLMSGLFLLLGRFFRPHSRALYVIVMLVQALAFAGCHYLPSSPEQFHMTIFVIRTLGGLYFGYIYQERGFGIAAGSHALYDVIAVTLNDFS